MAGDQKFTYHDMVKKFTEMGLIDKSKEVGPQIVKIKQMNED